MSKDELVLVSTLSTALAWMRTFSLHRPHGPRPDPLEASDIEDVLSHASAKASIVDRIFKSRLSCGTTTELLVPPGNTSHQIKGVRVHKLSASPVSGALWRSMTDGYFVVSPELLFGLMSRETSTALTALLGYELCGSYSLCPDGRADFVARDPLTTPELIAKVLNGMGLLNDRSRANAALRHVLPGSASPMESRVALVSVMPRSKGGMGMPAPKLNGCVKLSLSERRRLGVSYLKCDLLWRDLGVAIEYDSLQFHGTSTALSRTLDRQSVLEEKGIHVISVTGSDMHDAHALAGKAEALCKAAGLRKRPFTESSLKEMSRLLDELASADWV